jgi:hypothetical protein
MTVLNINLEFLGYSILKILNSDGYYNNIKEFWIHDIEILILDHNKAFF